MIILAIPQHYDTDPILTLRVTPEPVPAGATRYLYQLVDADGRVLHGGSGSPEPTADEPSTPQRAVRVLAAFLADEGGRLNAEPHYGTYYDEHERAALITYRERLRTLSLDPAAIDAAVARHDTTPALGSSPIAGLALLDLDLVVTLLRRRGLHAHLLHHRDQTVSVQAWFPAPGDQPRRGLATAGPGQPLGNQHTVADQRAITVGPADPVSPRIAVPDDTDERHLADLIAATVNQVATDQDRFEQAAASALDALWQSFTAAYPEAGGNWPGPDDVLEHAAHRAFTRWLHRHRPGSTSGNEARP
ncbi:hypothetical protein Aca07nite_84350 [Actinoplanes capillaceus]|uniref:Uncharacterized protein n=1 Tax=Actinoplanes campanulatus TaxID=113559 RepID=A0ABQ3WY06_9ACTN|nr:hypothetical protein [Actinoplanes capillaceus]GID51160.1 hypothetical protein Aca07nite_84350 [Actinoplanes capillaceus]